MRERISDQADGLRRLMSRGPGRIVAVVGCRPAVGASSVARNLAAALVQQGRQVLLVDERINSPPTSAQRQGSIVLLDAALDVQGRLSALATQADHVLVVLQPHVAAITAAYACIKRLHQAHALQRVRVLINYAVNTAEAQRILTNLTQAGDRYLAVALEPAGCVRADPRLPQAQRLNLSVVEAFQGSPSAMDFSRLAAELQQWPRLLPGTNRAMLPAAIGFRNHGAPVLEVH